MGKLFNLKEILKDEIGDTSDKYMNEVRSFDLARTGGFLSIVKYLIFGILALLNFQLFVSHVPGVMGVALGCVALLFEGCCVYFWNKQNKSAGKHKIALQVFALLFTVISFVHGCASLYQLTEVGPSIAEAIYNYSKYIAFPLLFGSMVLAIATLHYFHWSTQISEVRANALLKAEEGRAELITQSLELRHQGDLDRAQLRYFEEKTRNQEELTGALERYVAIKRRADKVIEGIDDSDLRTTILHALGKTDTPTYGHKRINPLPIAATSETPKD